MKMMRRLTFINYIKQTKFTKPNVFDREILINLAYGKAFL